MIELGFILAALIAGCAIGVVTCGLAVAAKRLQDSDEMLDGAIDIGRVNWVEQMQCTLVWNALEGGWAILDVDNEFIACGGTARAAIDRARAVVTKEAAPNG